MDESIAAASPIATWVDEQGAGPLGLQALIAVSSKAKHD
jgi:hypothetical protein